jgi:hypothetical protein
MTFGRCLYILYRLWASIVRGFAPENPSISRRLTPLESIPVEPRVVEERKRPKFFIASSVSDSDEEYARHSLKSSMYQTRAKVLFRLPV